MENTELIVSVHWCMQSQPSVTGVYRSTLQRLQAENIELMQRINALEKVGTL